MDYGDNNFSCAAADKVTGDGKLVTDENDKIYITLDFTNKCTTVRDGYGNCCADGMRIRVDNVEICTNSLNYDDDNIFELGNPNSIAYFYGNINYLVCVGNTNNAFAANGNFTQDYPDGQAPGCSRDIWTAVNDDRGIYTALDGYDKIKNYYNIRTGTCLFDIGTYTGNWWLPTDDCKEISAWPTKDDNNLFIGY